MLNAAIIASVPAAASLANTVLTQVREGSQSFAATLSDTLQSQAAPTAASSPTNFAEAIQDLADSLRPQADLVLIKPVDFDQLRDLASRLRPD